MSKDARYGKSQPLIFTFIIKFMVRFGNMGSGGI
jgi:hypothetical protein